MKNALRLLVVTCTSIAALAFAGAAMAAYTSPQILVKGGTAGGMILSVSQERADDATARVVIYVPQGYTTATTQAPNTTIGTVAARAQAFPSDVILPLEGNIVAVERTPFLTPAAQCGAANPNAVWILRLTVAGQTINLPMYVHTITSGPEASFASARLTVCLASPYVPPAQGGAPNGAKLLSATLTFNDAVFAIPSTAGQFRWTSVWTPYNVGTAVANPTATVETQSLVRLRPQATLNLKRLRANRLSMYGGVSENRVGVASARLRIRVTGPRRFTLSFRTNARGAYSRTVRITRRGTYRATLTATVPDRTLGAASCTKVATAGTPLPCVNATAGGFTRTITRAFRWR